MSTCTKKEVEVVVPSKKTATRFEITLSEDEAIAMVKVIGSVGGKIESSVREYIDPLWDKCRCVPRSKNYAFSVFPLVDTIKWRP